MSDKPNNTNNTTKINLKNYSTIQKLMKFNAIKGKFVANYISVNPKYNFDFFIVFDNEVEFIWFTSKIDDNVSFSMPHRRIALVVFE